MPAREWIQAAVVVGGTLWLFDHYVRAPAPSTAEEVSDEGDVAGNGEEVFAEAEDPPLPPQERYREPAAARGWSAQDQATLTALQRNCQVAVNNNAGGEYPALQEMACTRYARFAAEHGVDTGPLPAIRVASRQPVPASAPPVLHREPDEDPACRPLIAEKAAIDQRMRQPYTNAEGNYYRPRLHELYQAIWRHHCKES